MGLPVALDPVLGACLHEALCAPTPGCEAVTGTLRAALDDPAVHTVVLAQRLSAEPSASLVQVIRASDPLAQWIDLSCI
ncbi:hypothetical protein LP414_04950 [Polaromonas sp. P1(28)-13]|nr:hypothetical protein LP414_04950 [Polaromonas sp. P1(28)-13]